MLRRFCAITEVAVTTSAATTGKFDYRNFAGGQVYVPANSSLTTLTWRGSHDGVTYLPVQDGAGTAVASTVTPSTTGCCCLIPASCFACAFLKAVGNAAGTIYLSLKS